MGNNVSKLRGKHQMTQTALAQKIGVTKQALSLVETGKLRLTWKNAVAISDILGENVFEVLGTDAIVFEPRNEEEKAILIEIIKGL